ncbi:MAG: hypothetical protein HZB40_15885 [Rhodocyclales bacterium]|nr:hypothetical protein [Rhodocyclales bacterium]
MRLLVSDATLETLSSLLTGDQNSLHPQRHKLTLELNQSSIDYRSLIALRPGFEKWLDEGHELTFTNFADCLLLELVGANHYERCLPSHNLRPLCGTAQLILCKNCTYSSDCIGVSTLPNNFSRWAFRYHGYIRADQTSRLTSFNDPVVARLFSSFNDHVRTAGTKCTDRAIHFARKINLSRPVSLKSSERFIYYCYALSDIEIVSEFAFLRKNVVNGAFAKKLLNLYTQSTLHGYAYSVMQDQGRSLRETFYLFPRPKFFGKVAKYFQATWPEYQGALPYFMGIDFCGGECTAFKYYYRINKSTAARIFFDRRYLSLSTDDIVYVVRIGGLGDVSNKCEPRYSSKDFEVYRSIFQNFDSALYDAGEISINRVSFDYSFGLVTKLNVYYCPSYAGL